MRSSIILSIIILLNYSSGYGQSVYSAPLKSTIEKSFEHNIYQFKPNYLNPFGFGGFGSATPGLIDEQLLNLHINPAFLVTDSLSNNYIYLDFRENHNRDIKTNNFNCYVPWINNKFRSDIANKCSIPQGVSIKRHEPKLSGAYLLRPFGSKLGRFSIGATYQIIYENEPYFNPVQDTYQSVLGYSFVGIRSFYTQNLRYDDLGELDNLKHEGRFFSLLTGFEVIPHLDFAMRLSRMLFKQDGSISSSDISSIEFENKRNYNYNHWDISAGFNYKFSNKVIAGVMGGYLKGKAVQNFDVNSHQIVEEGGINVGSNWNYYFSAGLSDQLLDHSGRTIYAGMNVKAHWSPRHKWSFYYRHLRQSVNISLHSIEHDTSYSHSYNEGALFMSGSEASSAYQEIRFGTGSHFDFSHRFGAAMQWNVFRKTRLNFCLIFDAYMRKIQTSEDISLYSFSESRQFDTNSDDQAFNKFEERSRLNWDFKMDVMSIQLPVLINQQISNFMELHFGVNQRLTGWWYKKDNSSRVVDFLEKQSPDSDETYRILQSPNGYDFTYQGTTRSDITTTVLAGVTISPSRHYQVRFMMTPHFIKTNDGTKLREVQWWINLNLSPKFW